ncbi:Dihydroorotase [Aulographum hederae CBS 113979]|uniref:dihydroorotase n=1 Tax=Aulographum hederae CBS 113979 TaxID=1176131 RepID=A0A6G1H1D0_9PEZI|nr:Dihydroorotase [Aulographum hederae CBS 113979]
MAVLSGQELRLPASADFHVHLRDGDMMETVTKTIRKGGVDTVYVMPNLVPPVTTVEHALDYKRRLESIEPNVTFLMSLYLHESMTPQAIVNAKKAGIIGVKSYPAGVTTNSSSGVVDYTSFYPIFEAMQEQDLILNLHGEVPSKGDVTVLSAEERFLPTLFEIHQKFPRLRIVLEHCTTAAAVEAVKKCGPAVVGTITAHHLSIIVDDWVSSDMVRIFYIRLTSSQAGDPYCFCKPVAKTPADRDALLRAAVSGNPKIFFGSDSAPHPATSKRGGDKIAAGVFTQPYATQTVLDALEQACKSGVLRIEEITQEILEGFLSAFGRAFYRAENPRESITLKKQHDQIIDVLASASGDIEVVPFRRGQKTWSLTWS